MLTNLKKEANKVKRIWL